MARFVLLSVLTLTFAMAGLMTAGTRLLGAAPESNQAGAWLLASWTFEAVVLVVLFLFVQGRTPFWWLDGLITGWVAWLFRGPLLYLTLSAMAVGSGPAWRSLVFEWWVRYSLCGLVLAVIARWSRLESP